MRGGDHDPLLADVHARLDQFLDGAGAGHRVGLLQPVQHRADAGRGVQGGVQGGVHVRAADPAGVQRAGARAGGYVDIAAVVGAAVGPGRGVDGGFGMVLALLAGPLHERKFVR